MDPRRTPHVLASQADAALRQVRHRDPNRTRQDVLALLQQSLYLEVRATPNPPPYGPPVLNVGGTITTHYRGNAYQTPLVIYLSPEYPSVPPTIMLNPTPDMAVDRRCPHIDASGRVVHPCVHGEWRPTSTLVECIYLLASAFGDGGVPPLRAADPGLRAGGGPTTYPPPGVGQQQGGGHMGGGGGGARYPPTPMQGGGQPGGALLGYAQPPQGGYGQPSGRPGLITPAPIAAQFGANPFGYPSAGGQGAGQAAPQYAYPPAQQQQPVQQQAAQQQQQQQAGLPSHGSMRRQNSDSEVKDEMRAAVVVRLQARLQGEYERLGKEAEDIAGTADRLLARQAAVETATWGLTERKAVLGAYIKETRERKAQLTAWLAEYEAAGADRPVLARGGGGGGGGGGDDDASTSSAGRRSGSGTSAMRDGREGGWLGGDGPESVVPTTALGRQLLWRVVEDVAYEDYLPYVDEAVQAGKVRPDEGLAEVRDVARKQFQARALARKIDGALETAARQAADLQRQFAHPGVSPPVMHTGGLGGGAGVRSS